MKKVRWVPATVGAAMVAATLALPAAGVAYASGNGNVTGDGNIPLLSGNTLTAPVSVPVNLCGVAVTVVGVSEAGCEGGSASTIAQDGTGQSGGTGSRNGTGSHNSTSSHNGNVTGVGNLPVGSGNTVTAPVSVPVNLCGVSAAVAGSARAGCRGGSTSTISGAGGGSRNGNVTGVGNVPVLSGNTITAPVSAPVNLCGISLALLGFSSAGCQGGSTSCIGSNCSAPCTHCHTRPPCLADDCHTPPPCTGDCHLPPPCTGDCHVPPPCTSSCHVPPPCNCHVPPPCHGTHCTPPGCQLHCSPDTPPGPQQGISPGGIATATTTRAMTSGSLPTTGADLLLLGVAAVGTMGIGAGTVALARRRRNGEVL